MEHKEPKTYVERRSTAWETHFATIVNAVIIAGIGFLGSQVWVTNTKLTEFAVTNKFLVDSIKDLKMEITNLNENYVTKADFKDLETRVRAVEQKQGSR